MSGECNDCGNPICICHIENEPTSVMGGDKHKTMKQVFDDAHNRQQIFGEASIVIMNSEDVIKLKAQSSTIHELNMELAKLKQENKKLKNALACYALTLTQDDNGKLAREVLEELRE